MTLIVKDNAVKTIRENKSAAIEIFITNVFCYQQH